MAPNTTYHSNEPPVVSNSDRTETELYITMSMLAFLSLIGTAGNALVIAVFARKRDKMTSTLFILTLAVIDFTTCLVIVPYTIFMEYVNFGVEYNLVCKVYQFFITSNVPFSCFIMAAIAVDRYFCICHPFLHAMTLLRAKVIILGLGLLATCCGVITACAYSVYAEEPVSVSINGSFLFPANVSSPEMTTPMYAIADYSSTAGYGGEEGVLPAETVLLRQNTSLFDSITKQPQLNSDSLTLLNKTVIIYTGKCKANTMIISNGFRRVYQKIYTAMFLLAFIIVAVLYVLIYQSVQDRRKKRQKQKNRLPSLTCNDDAIEETQLTAINGDAHTKETNNHSSCRSAAKSIRRKSTKRDRNRVANIRTALMLFVVTLVFTLTFAPAFLMALQIIPYNQVVFYMYFANNVANPVIYCFMNKNFRDDLKNLKTLCFGR